jgi:hypothetical protein
MFTVIGAGAVAVAAVQLPFGIVVVHVKLTLGAKPAGAGVGTVVKFPPNDPALFVTVAEAGSPVTAKSPPTPLNADVCMAPPAAAVSVPLSEPVAVGAKLTWIVHTPPAARPPAPPQVSGSLKLVLAVIVNTCAAGLVFVSVTV